MTHIDQIIHTQADLEQVWRTLMEPLGFSDGSLWLLGIGPDDRPTKMLVEIKDEGAPPSLEQAANLGEMLAMLGDDVEPGTRWALLRSRPGCGTITRADRALLGAILAACRHWRVPTEVAHLATDEALLPVPYDELAASA